MSSDQVIVSTQRLGWLAEKASSLFFTSIFSLHRVSISKKLNGVTCDMLQCCILLET